MAEPDSVKSKNRAPEFLADLLDHTKAILIKHGMSDNMAEQVSREVSSQMQSVWGGQQIYFAYGLRASLSERDQKIYDEFCGDNHAELARKFQVSVQWVYKIVKHVRAEDMARRQGNLEL
jgi:Mor family transcriptional regulator